MDKELILKDILLSKIPNDCHWKEMDNLTNCPIEYVLEAMKDFGEKLLVLAAENVTLLDDGVDIGNKFYVEADDHFYSDCTITPHRQSIINTIDQVKLVKTT